MEVGDILKAGFGEGIGAAHAAAGHNDDLWSRIPRGNADQGAAVRTGPAIDQQSGATRDISANVQQAARHTSSVSEGVGAVTETSERVGGAAGRVLGAAEGLSEQSQALKRQVSQFLETIRAA